MKKLRELLTSKLSELGAKPITVDDVLLRCPDKSEPYDEPKPGSRGSEYHYCSAYGIISNQLMDKWVRAKCRTTNTFYELIITEVKLEDDIYHVKGLRLDPITVMGEDHKIKKTFKETQIDEWIPEQDVFINVFW